MKKGKHTENIEYLSKRRFKELAVYRDLYCISIYLASHQKEKNSLAKVKSTLKKYSKESQIKREVQGLNIESIEQHAKDLKPIIEYWENSPQVSNISFFLNNHSLEVYQNKFNVPFEVYVNDHFYLKHFAQEFASAANFDEVIDEKHVNVVTDIDEIIKLSYEGSIKKLYLAKGEDVIGELDEENGFVLISENEEGSTSLSNLATIKTVLNNGDVFLIENKDFPLAAHRIIAIK